MTTIAYRDGVIAYDSLATAGDMVVDDDCNKLFKRDGIIYIMAGTLSDSEKLIESYQTGRYIDECNASNFFVVDSDKVYCCGVNKDDGFWKDEQGKAYNAVGSGQSFAFGAMDMGATAKEAVRVAAKRDVYTGGRIRLLKVKNGH